MAATELRGKPSSVCHMRERKTGEGSADQATVAMRKRAKKIVAVAFTNDAKRIDAPEDELQANTCKEAALFRVKIRLHRNNSRTDSSGEAFMFLWFPARL